jgi:hypothetical protein
LNRALKWRPGREAHDVVEEFRTRVNGGKGRLKAVLTRDGRESS